MAEIADKIRIAQDKDGMLRRALERIIQLYTDKSHFIYELLQNAEDAEATSIKFIQYSDRLEVLHNGRPFTSENLQGLCDIGKSDKVDNLNQIGEFGVGFKSVFGICNTVRLYSIPQNFREFEENDAELFAVEINDFIQPQDIPIESLDSSYTTRFVFPFTIGETFSGFTSKVALQKALSKKLQNLGITTLLFMNSLSLIEYQIEEDGQTITGQYLLDKKYINDHCSLVCALGDSNANNADSNECAYLKFSRRIEEDSLRTVDIAFSVLVDNNGDYECQQPQDPYVSVYFPTETESKLNFIVQGPYRTTPNRSSIPSDDSDNQKLAKTTALLLKDVIIELRDAGKLNMSFLKAFPFSQKVLGNSSLFLPLYDTVRYMFGNEKIIPCKDGCYISAKYAKIARQEKLTLLFNDALLTSLVNDNNRYCWLPTVLTETNREYEHVYRFLTGELGIGVIRPEDLRVYFAKNPTFLPQRDNDWIIELYLMLEKINTAFSRSGNETNLLTSDIIKTSDGRFVAAYRKIEGQKFIPNVFLPSEKVAGTEFNLVDMNIYEKCHHFFDDILELHKPNEYEFIINDIKKRYSAEYSFNENKHIEDLKFLLKYRKDEDHKDEVDKVIKECIVLRCNDNTMRSPYSVSSARLYLPINEKGQQIEAYQRNIVSNVFYINTDFYYAYDITLKDLMVLGVLDSILTGETIVQGMYDNGLNGKQPAWWTPEEFRWKLSIQSIKDVLKYISAHPTSKDSTLKSKVIFSVLMDNESKLSGAVHIGGNTPNLENETCDLIKILKGEKAFGWDGKWLFTESGELVSQKAVSKHEISASIYGPVNTDSIVYQLLGFKKTEIDEIDELKKTVSKKQLDAYFEIELKQRFGITLAELSEISVSTERGHQTKPDDILYPFPIVRVKNWDTLKKHAAEMLIFANPVKYDFMIRHVRVSNSPREVRAYLLNMYRYDGIYKYACQLCHDSCSNIEATQLFNKPDTELDPMNLCLCPTCASKYRLLRNDDNLMYSLQEEILGLKENEVMNGDQVIIRINEQELWFTQTHFAEIQVLLRMRIYVDKHQTDDITTNRIANNDEKDGLSVYSGYIGKHVKRKDGLVGKIMRVDPKYLYIYVEQGEKLGQELSISLKIFLELIHSTQKVYEVFDQLKGMIMQLEKGDESEKCQNQL